jgi:hypothetical protein
LTVPVQHRRYDRNFSDSLLFKKSILKGGSTILIITCDGISCMNMLTETESLSGDTAHREDMGCHFARGFEMQYMAPMVTRNHIFELINFFNFDENFEASIIID